MGGELADEILEVTIRADGRVEMHVQGVEGMACLTDTQELVARLGGDVESQELTAEAYVETGEEHHDRLWQ
ncbi:DUF2997 domain-containing protein [Streptomyces sp. NPDC006527]|uniref:DUF2997 domain-containing protein n=1 Tax=Streptomyces sp. NPDC006527 TaxID=3364749 RepID=UPI0036BA7A3F